MITAITHSNAPPAHIKVTSYPVFSSDPTQNANMASQVQYAMSKDDTSYGTAPGAAMSNGQEIIAKTGTTNTAQSAFFIGAIPSQALAVALFTRDQDGQDRPPRSRRSTASAAIPRAASAAPGRPSIWHTYAEDMFVPLGVEPFPTPVFTGPTWNQVPPSLRNVGKPKKPDHGRNGGGNGDGNGNGNGGPTPFPTFSCDPAFVTCQPGNGGGGNGGGNGGFGGRRRPVNAAPAGAGLGARRDRPARVAAPQTSASQRAASRPEAS